MMSSFSKQRTTWTMASTSRMLARNLFPRPAPVEAPSTRPAIVDELDRRGDELGRTAHLAEHLEPFVRHGHDADVRIDRAKGVVRRLRLAGAGDGVEEGGFAHVGESDDACL